MEEVGPLDHEVSDLLDALIGVLEVCGEELEERLVDEFGFDIFFETGLCAGDGVVEVDLSEFLVDGERIVEEAL